MSSSPGAGGGGGDVRLVSPFTVYLELCTLCVLHPVFVDL